MSVLRLNDVISQVKSVPALPEAAFQALNKLSDPEAKVREVSTLVTRDAGLSGAILKTVNSAAFGLTNPLTDLPRAIAMLGFSRVRQLILNLSLLRAFKPLALFSRAEFVAIWRHLAVTGGIARRTGEFMADVDPDDCFVAGLFHDVGKLILCQYAPAHYRAVLQRAKTQAGGFYEAERDLFETHHGEIGAWLLDQWTIPRPIIQAISYHHYREMQLAHPMTALVGFASQLASETGAMGPGRTAPPPFDREAWKILRISVEHRDALARAAEEERKLADAILAVGVV